MKRKELMAIVAVAAGLSSGVAATTHAYAAPKLGIEHGQDNDDRGGPFGFGGDHVHPGHFIGQGHFHHGNGHGYGHNHHDHDIY